jgi:acyl dehydratase
MSGLAMTDTGKLFWEDFAVGEVSSFGPRLVTREEIIAFAAQFDPQPMHLDEEAAKSSMLGGLAASGWHTCAILMRMMADWFVLKSASMGGPGVEEVKWLKPVRPGDQLTAKRTILESRASSSRPEMGLVKFAFELTNQTGAAVLNMTCTIMVLRRAAAAAA